MSETVWIKHEELAVWSEVPKDSLPTWRQGGWQPVTQEELDDYDQGVRDEVAAAETYLREFGEQGVTPPPLGLTPTPAAENAERTPSNEDATGRQIKKEIG